MMFHSVPTRASGISAPFSIKACTIGKGSVSQNRTGKQFGQLQMQLIAETVVSKDSAPKRLLDVPHLSKLLDRGLVLRQLHNKLCESLLRYSQIIFQLCNAANFSQ